MANLIDLIKVNGTEYEVVGHGSAYPVIIPENGVHAVDFPDADAVYASDVIEPSFEWVKIEKDGETSYKLAILSDPTMYSYTEADAC